MAFQHLGRWSKISLQFGGPMGLTGVALWGYSGWFTDRVLGHSHGSTLAVDTTGAETVTLSFRVRVLALDAEIDRQSEVTEVSVRTSGSSLQEMEFEYPLVDYADIEQAIAQDLGLTPETVRALIRYRID